MNETPRRSRRGVRSVGVSQGVGGAKGIRTPDLLNAIQTLSQLSYSPTPDGEYTQRRRARSTVPACPITARDPPLDRTTISSGAPRNGPRDPRRYPQRNSRTPGGVRSASRWRWPGRAARESRTQAEGPSRCRCSQRSRARAAGREHGADAPPAVARRPRRAAPTALVPVTDRRRRRVRARRPRGADPRVRPILQTEVVSAFDSLLDAPPDGDPPPDRGALRPRRSTQARLRGQPRRARAPRPGADQRRHGLRADRAAAQRRVRSPRSWSTARTTSTSSAAARSCGSTRRSSTTSTCSGSSTGSSRRSAGASTRSSPRVDARLPDGSRVNAIIEPLSLIGPVITVRKFSTRPYTVDDLIRFGTATPEMFEFLRACIEARLNVFVSGGTGSGKTTTLNVLSSFIPNGERIVTIEDAAELQLRQEHVRHARVAPAQPRGRGRDHDPRPAAQRDAHAPRPHHRRRVPLRRGAGHAPGDDDRPRRLALDGPREQPRATCSAASRRWC